MAKTYMRHGHRLKKPRTPRKPRPPSGPARAGFTYGYQWSAVQPEPWLRFPIEDQGFKLYPVVKRGMVDVAIEGPDDPYRPPFFRWLPLSTLSDPPRLSPHHGPEAPPFDETRVRVALDWHAENGFSVNPYHLSGKSWGAVKFLRRNGWTNPLNWMDELNDFWRRIVNDGTNAEWGRAPDALWWLDHELKHPDDWYDLRERLWPQAYAEVAEAEENVEDDQRHFEDEEPDEPEEDDITTEDHQHWYQYGRLYFTGDEDGLERQMVRDNFFPNVWFVSDHGNAHLIDVFNEAIRIRQDRLR